MSYVIGLDYGTDSVRAVLVDTVKGNVLSSSVFAYPRWKKGLYCEPAINQFRQHPLDHLEGLEATLSEVVRKSEVKVDLIKAICVDTTGSSPMAVNEQGASLALEPDFEGNPNAMMLLWKDHTAIAEANEITAFAKNWGGEDFTKFSGGLYSSEWFWAKILSIHRKDKSVAAGAYTWMEHCDYITGVLTGLPPALVKRSRCAAGHKALWHQSWNGLPSDDFLVQLDESLRGIRDRLFESTYTSVEAAGKISKVWARKLGLSEETLVAVGTIDAHAGAVGAGITENTLVKVVGTSTCDILIASAKDMESRLVPGICGQVNGSVVPGWIGLEAGQAGFGDILAWFSSMVAAPLLDLIQKNSSLSEAQKSDLIGEISQSLLIELSEKASNLPTTENDLIALDWINGRRSPDVDESLKGGMMNIGMGTSAAHIFKALVEALCFGSRRISERFEEQGVRIDEVIAVGGVAKKSELVMQTMADVLQSPIKISSSDQTPALGAAIYAAVAAGIYDSLEEAISRMAPGFEKTYLPQEQFLKYYNEKYQTYLKLGDFSECLQ
ncbi:ribulokinase [Algoriphagus vanfongensis]|uniref:ribulokinase n=1 Tax=Algoriphagus vanfongensis TaxID=426371 RepID=UPI00041EE01A|nr:ribulokinase [Algoriphagus vanfongensis]